MLAVFLQAKLALAELEAEEKASSAPKVNSRRFLADPRLSFATSTKAVFPAHQSPRRLSVIWSGANYRISPDR
jgi:hypothetical protein